MGLRVLAREKELREPFLVFLRGWTEQDYFRRLDGVSRVCEYVRGEVIMHSPALLRHDEIVAFLRELIAGFLRRRPIGKVMGEPYTMRLEPGVDYEPDLFVVRAQRMSALTPHWLEGRADFVIEVVSPGARSHDLKRKRADYEAHGIPEYWAIDHEKRRAHAFGLVDGAYEEVVLASGRLQCTPLPGFWIDVGWLWKDPLPDPQACLRKILRRR